MSTPTSTNNTTITPPYLTHNSDLPPLSPLIPSTYSRLYLSPSSIPTPKIVGVLACQRDPYLRRLRSRIVSVGLVVSEENGNGNAGEKKDNKSKGKGGKKEKLKVDSGPQEDDAQLNGKVETKPKINLYELTFEDTVLFPEGGGQPFDTGYILVPSGSSSSGQSSQANPDSDNDALKLRVINVHRRGLTAIHVVEIPQEVEGLLLGKEGLLGVGKEIEMVVDWERRIDHMTLHTAQHLLSSLLDTHLSLPTLSWFLPPHPSLEPCYVELSRSLTQQEAKEMEEKANELVTMGWGEKRMEEDVSVWIESRVQGFGMGSGGVTPVNEGEGSKGVEGVEKEGLGLVEGVAEQQRGQEQNHQGQPVVDGNEIKEWGDRESRGLPKDYSNGIIRTAVIDQIDRSLCCGTHHPSLSQIKLMHVLPPTSTTISNKPTRLLMVAGPRAFKHLIKSSEVLVSAAVGYTCPRWDVGEKVVQREGFRKDTDRGMKAMRAELGKAIGASGIDWRGGTSTSREAQGEGTGESLKKALLIRGEESTHDFEFMGLINTTAISTLKETSTSASNGSTVKEPDFLLIILSTIASNVTASNTDALSTLIQITSNPPSLAKDIGDRLKSGIDGIEGGEKGRVKGGGAKGRWMGKVSGKWGKLEGRVVSDLLE